MLQSLISNKLSIEKNEKYCVIIGSNASKTARSPKLWNAVFKDLKSSMRMYPLDVKKNNLKKLLSYLEKDPYFVGGSIAVPYKEIVFKYLKKNLLDKTLSIGALNCIYKKRNKLSGTNTDGEASITSFIDKFNTTKNKNILILGFGGVSKAILPFFKSKLSKKNKLIVASRNSKDSRFLNKNSIEWINFSKINNTLINMDIIINATSIGAVGQLNKTPISKENFKLVKKNAIIFELNYYPSKTLLQKMADKNKIKNMNGSEMNILQAALAMNYVLNFNYKKILKYMKNSLNK